MSKELQPHQQRVVDELHELSDKIQKLTVFTHGDIFRGLTPVDQGLLRTQLDTMKAYGNVLETRIARF